MTFSAFLRRPVARLIGREEMKSPSEPPMTFDPASRVIALVVEVAPCYQAPGAVYLSVGDGPKVKIDGDMLIAAVQAMIVRGQMGWR